MKLRTLIGLNVAVLAMAGLSLQGAEAAKYFARSGSKMRIEGTSNIHDWQVESTLIGGSLEAGENFPTEPGQTVKPGKVEAKADTFVSVMSLKSVEKDGSPYSDKMDEIMYEKLKAQETKKITFHLTELTLKEVAKSKDDPYLLEAKGELAVAGLTNVVTMPVKVIPAADKSMKISGGPMTLKMTDFKIDPPAPKIALGLIKTGDEVKILFDWKVAQRAPGK
jgi:hypothetical protein